MKRKDLIILWETLIKIEKRPYILKFSYFIAKNKLFLKDEITILNALKMPSKEYRDYDLKRIDLARKYADLDENSKAKIENNSFVITEKIKEFETEFNKLKEEYKDHIKKFQDQISQFNSLIEKDYENELSTIELKDMPDSIEPDILETLLRLGLIKE